MYFLYYNLSYLMRCIRKSFCVPVDFYAKLHEVIFWQYCIKRQDGFIFGTNVFISVTLRKLHLRKLRLRAMRCHSLEIIIHRTYFEDHWYLLRKMLLLIIIKAIVCIWLLLRCCSYLLWPELWPDYTNSLVSDLAKKFPCRESNPGRLGENQKS